MSEQDKAHNEEKAVREIQAIARFLPVLAAKDEQFSFLEKYSAELDMEAARRPCECRDIADLQIGMDGVLRRNSDSAADKDAFFNCDFALSLKDREIAEFAKKGWPVPESVAWTKIYIEVTDCVNEAEQMVYNDSKLFEKMPQDCFYSIPVPPKPELAGETDLIAEHSGKNPKKLKREAKKADAHDYIEQAKSRGGSRVTGDGRVFGWAEKMAADIKNKICRKENYLKERGQDWAQEHRSGNELWLLINSSYDVEFAYPAEKLTRALIWQMGKEGLENFMPFSRVIIRGSQLIGGKQPFLVFKGDWLNCDIWRRSEK